MSNLKNFVVLTNHFIKNCELIPSFCFRSLLKPVKSDLFNFGPFLNFHTTPRMKSELSRERGRARRAEQRKDQGIQGSDSSLLDMSLNRQKDIFPTHDLETRLFNGVPFKEIPIVHIKASKNNTIISLAEKGETKVIRSCGTEGFKNCRKGTNVAGQTTGVAFGLRAIKRGYKDVRVMLRGLGPGRLSAMKGIQLSGMNIISITDDTTNYTGKRPKKERRL